MFWDDTVYVACPWQYGSRKRHGNEDAWAVERVKDIWKPAVSYGGKH